MVLFALDFSLAAGKNQRIVKRNCKQAIVSAPSVQSGANWMWGEVKNGGKCDNFKSSVREAEKPLGSRGKVIITLSEYSLVIVL